MRHGHIQRWKRIPDPGYDQDQRNRSGMDKYGEQRGTFRRTIHIGHLPPARVQLERHSGNVCICKADARALRAEPKTVCALLHDRLLEERDAPAREDEAGPEEQR